MSWLDKIKDQIIITCGDGKGYQPLWINATKDIEWHIAEFTFPELDGSLVNKGKKLGTRYNLELYFQGDDHLDKSFAFETSANDRRPWRISHPFYETLLVQPNGFHIDNTQLNVSKWTGYVIETIIESNPKIKVDPVSAISTQKVICDEAFAAALYATPTLTDVDQLNQTNKRNYNLTVPIIRIPSEAESYFNIFNKANSAVNTATASPLLAMRTTIAMINAPALFTISATSRINLMNQQFVTLRDTVFGLTNPSSKQIYQNLGGSMIGTMCLASSLALPGEFTNSNSSTGLIGTILAAYDNYLIDLDTLQTANGGNSNSFIPDAAALFNLSQLLNLAVCNLILIALTSKTERSIITETDTNIIILTHRFYGLDNNDRNIDELIANNNIGLNEMLQIKKNRKIVYYI